MESPKRLQNVFVVAERPAELHDFYQSALGLQLKFPVYMKRHRRVYAGAAVAQKME